MSNYQEGSEVAGRFVIQERVGEGGMGAVYRALQTSLDREVALKVLHSDVAFTARARRRFGREARAIARLNHPHIASVFDFGTDNDEQTLWLAMEMVDGHSMSRMKREDIDILRLMSVTDQVLSALSAAHARGIIHRDMKPSNVLITRDDEGREIIKLVDFGLAATQSGDLNLKGAPGGIENETEGEKKRMILGTPRYMAPEIFSRKPVDPRVDLYALGIILFEILAGSPPYPGDDPRELMEAHLHQPIPQLKARDDRELPPELERVIYRLMAKDLAERFQSAAEVREALQAVINEFSYVPWMVMGPQIEDPSSSGHPGNLSSPGFLSGYGGQTIPPTALDGSSSRLGRGSNQQAPLVGLTDERRAAERQIRRAVQQGKGSLVLLEGAAGVGKTRLIDWLGVRVEESGVMRLVRGVYSKSSGRFSGVRSVLDELFDTRDAAYDDVPRIVRNKLESWGFSDSEIELTVKLMQPGGEEAVFERGEPSADRQAQRRERVFSTVERVLRRSAQERPLLVVLEDLQYASGPTAAFLEHLALGLQLNPIPLIVLGSFRTGEIRGSHEMGQALERLSRFSGEDVARIKIGRLSDAEIESLIAKLAPVGDEVIEAIKHRSSGNPLHATEILRYLQESGKLVYDNGQLRLDDGVGIDDEIPNEIVDLMRYRARQTVENAEHPQAMRAILERCALLGRRFDYRLLRRLVTRESGQPWAEHLDPILERLVRDGVLREVGHSGEDILEFDHVLLRDVLLQDMSGKRSLKSLHKLAAESKIEFYGDRVDSKAPEIVEHYRRAREPRGVYIYTLKAARAAANASDLKQAMQLYREAEQLSESANAEQPEGLLAEASYVLETEEVALEVAHLERRVGEYASARDHYRKLLASDDVEIALWARWGLGKLSERQASMQEAEGWFEAARREARTARDLGEDRIADVVDAFSMHELARLAVIRSQDDAARSMFEDALEMAKSRNQRALEAKILADLCTLDARHGRYEQASEYHRRSIILAESIADGELVAEVRTVMAEFLVDRGRVDEAMNTLREAKETFKKLGELHAGGHCRLRIGWLQWLKGDYKEAARSLRKTHKIFQKFGDERGVTLCKLFLSGLALSIGRTKEARTLVTAATNGFDKIGDRRHLADCGLVRGRLARKDGDHEDALTRFDEALREFEDLELARRVRAAEAWRALVLEEMGRHDDVDAILADLEAVDLDDIGAEEFLATALDELSELLNSRSPMMAMELADRAEKVFRKMGRPVRETSG
jgi:serine/threonine protein kinase/tetratricopeptide (TPR) repeat protein